MFRNYMNLLTGFYVFRPDDPLGTGIEPLTGAYRPLNAVGAYYPSAAFYWPFDLVGLDQYPHLRVDQSEREQFVHGRSVAQRQGAGDRLFDQHAFDQRGAGMERRAFLRRTECGAFRHDFREHAHDEQGGVAGGHAELGDRRYSTMPASRKPITAHNTTNLATAAGLAADDVQRLQHAGDAAACRACCRTTVKTIPAAMCRTARGISIATRCPGADAPPITTISRAPPGCPSRPTTSRTCRCCRWGTGRPRSTAGTRARRA